MNILKKLQDINYQLLLFASVVAMSPLALDMYLPAMPTLAEYFQTDFASVQNSLSIYLVGYSCGLFFFGPLSDQLSRRFCIRLGLIGFAVMSTVIAFAPSIEVFIGARFVQAFLSAAATVVVPATIREIYEHNTAKGMSYVSMVMMLAPMMAPTIGSLILLFADWHFIFLTLCGYALFIALVSHSNFPERRTAPQQQASLTKAFIHNYKVVLGHAESRLDLISSMMVSLAFFAFLTSSSFVWMEVYQASEFEFAVLFGVNGFMALFAHFINSKLVDRKGSRKLLRWGTGIAMVLSAGMLMANVFTPSLMSTTLLLLPLMSAYSIIAVNSDALVLVNFRQQAGTAGAVIGVLRFGVGGLAGPILTFFYDGSAVPFAALMFVSVLTIVVCQVRQYVIESNVS